MLPFSSEMLLPCLSLFCFLGNTPSSHCEYWVREQRSLAVFMYTEARNPSVFQHLFFFFFLACCCPQSTSCCSSEESQGIETQEHLVVLVHYRFWWLFLAVSSCCPGLYTNASWQAFPFLKSLQPGQELEALIAFV